MLPFLANASTLNPSVAMAVGALIFFSLLAVFILSIVKACTRKSAGWIISAVMTGAVWVLVILIGVLGTRKDSASGGFLSSSSKESHVIKSKNGAISLLIPGHWNELPDLHDQAVLGAGQPAVEQYLIILPNPKIDFTGTLEDFDQGVLANFASKATDVNVSEPERLLVSECPAIRHRVEAVVDKHRITYICTQVETKDCFYQIMAWTLKSQEATAMPILQKASDSFVGTPPEKSAAPAAKPEVEDAEEEG